MMLIMYGNPYLEPGLWHDDHEEDEAGEEEQELEGVDDHPGPQEELVLRGRRPDQQGVADEQDHVGRDRDGHVVARRLKQGQTGYHWFELVITGYDWLRLVKTGYHWLRLDFTG